MTNTLLLRMLYRSLLRAAKPFGDPSPNAAVFSCLLHRTGIDDGITTTSADIQLLPRSNDDEKDMLQTEKTRRRRRQPKSVEEARDLTRSYAHDDEEDTTMLPLDERKTPSHDLFRRLLREVVTGGTTADGDGGCFRQVQFPSEVDTTRLKEVIRREFRRTDYSDYLFNVSTRQEVAFIALRELNKKLRWKDALLSRSGGKDDMDDESWEERNRRQAARNVFPLPLDPRSYLKAGTYLIAHPLLNGFFRRTVICILDHSNSSSSARTGGTYGLIVNRIAVEDNGKRRTLKEVLRTLPPELTQAFGNCSVREGGPVHMSLQMIHARTPDQPALGGRVLTVSTTDDTKSTALDSDRAIYYQGNVMDAADAVNTGALDRDDVSFYVGASCWDVGQLESEIDRGYFFPCSGPPEMALTGMCERVGDDDQESKRPRADLWLSMMCSLGEDEANLAHLFSNADDDEYFEYREACDMF